MQTHFWKKTFPIFTYNYLIFLYLYLDIKILDEFYFN